MNKRTQYKMDKKNNTAKHEKLLKMISDVFSVFQKEFYNGYVFFCFGKNSVCHFRLKETPDWKYGIWLSEQGYRLFGEHLELIDKFKPTHSYIDYHNDIKGFIEKVKKINESPKLYFVDSLTGNALHPFEEESIDGELYYSGYQVKKEFNEKTKLWDIIKRDTMITQEEYVNRQYESYFRRKEERYIEIENDRKYAFTFFKELPIRFDEIQAVGVIDSNKNEILSYPRYELHLIVYPHISTEELNMLFEKIYKLVQDRNSSEERKTHEHQFYLDSISTNKRVLNNCDYKYFKKNNL